MPSSLSLWQKIKKNLNAKDDQERGEQGGGRGKEQFLENIE